ncbi:MAG: hypothetical protein K6C34_05820 [Alphaproteobacteria bacterium]|nr:hypothetical protein [Alphaproteobacteria bacterium]
MKKVVFLGCLIAFGNVVAENTNDRTDAFNGFYVAAGASMGHSEIKTSVTWNSLGINCPAIAHKKFDLFGASAAVGYGKVLANNIYVGSEVLVDILEDKKFSGTYEWDGTVPYRGKIRGFTPSVSIKVGYRANCISTLFYVKAGAAYVKSDFYDGYIDAVTEEYPNAEKHGQSHDIAKIVPIIGGGVEKKFGSFGLRLEGDYRFNTSKNNPEWCKVPGRSNELRVKVRSRINSYVVRLMATYNFR